MTEEQLAAFERWRQEEPSILWDHLQDWFNEPYANDLFRETRDKQVFFTLMQAAAIERFPDGKDWLESIARARAYDVIDAQKFSAMLTSAEDQQALKALSIIAQTPEFLVQSASLDPLAALDYLDDTPTAPHAVDIRAAATDRDVLLSAAEREPAYTLSSYARFQTAEAASEAMRIAASLAPNRYFALLDKPGAVLPPDREALLALASSREALERALADNPLETAQMYSHYAHQPYADEVRARGLSEEVVLPWIAQSNYYDYRDVLALLAAQPYGERGMQEVSRLKDFPLSDVLDVLATQPYGTEFIRDYARRAPDDVARLTYDRDQVAKHPALVLAGFETLAQMQSPEAISMLDGFKAAGIDLEPVLPSVLQLVTPETAHRMLYDVHAFTPRVKEAVLDRIIEVDPEEALNFYQYGDEPERVEALKKLAAKLPFATLSFETTIRESVEQNQNAAGFAEFGYPPELRQELLAIAVQQDLSNAAEIDPIGYYRYNSLLPPFDAAERARMETQAAEGIRQKRTEADPGFYLEVSATINYLHNEDTATRFAIVDNGSFDAAGYYDLIVHSREELFTSTYNGLLDRMFASMEAESLPLATLLSDPARLATLPAFLEVASSYSRVGEVFDRIPPDERATLISRILEAQQDDGVDDLKNAISLAETMNHLKDPETIRMMEQLFIDAHGKATDSAQLDKLGLVGAWYNQHRTGPSENDAFFASLAQDPRYMFGDLTQLPADRLFDAQGRNFQVMTFFDDPDGHASFDHFLRQYQRSPSWAIKEHPSYVEVYSTQGREMHIFADRPHSGADNDGVKDIQAALAAMDAQAQVYTHRGHSYHVKHTVDILTPDAALVSLGSCGGYQNIASVLAASPNAHIIATTGTGTMYVNDPLLFHINERLRRDEPLVWEDVWEHLATMGDKRRSQYIDPSQNTAAMLVTRYKQLREQESAPDNTVETPLPAPSQRSDLGEDPTNRFAGLVDRDTLAWKGDAPTEGTASPPMTALARPQHTIQGPAIV